MTNQQKTVHGMPVATVKISGKDYVTVAERSRFAHETFGTGDMFGYDIIERQFITLGDRHFISVTIRIQEHTYCGTSEIRLNNAPGGSADAKAPIECAETSAVGRALGFAGIGALDSIASADEIQRANDQNRSHAPQPQSTPRPPAATAQPARAVQPTQASAVTTEETVTGGKVRSTLNRAGYLTIITQDAFLVELGIDPTLRIYPTAVYQHVVDALQKAGVQA